MKQPQCADDVVVVILKRLRNRLADGLETGEMNDCVGLRFLQRLFKSGFISNIALNEQRPATRDLFNAVNDAGIRVRQVVLEHNIVTGLEQ